MEIARGVECLSWCELCWHFFVREHERDMVVRQCYGIALQLKAFGLQMKRNEWERVECGLGWAGR